MEVAIIEDDGTTAKLLKELLESEGVTVRALYRTGEEALADLDGRPCPAVVFVDLGLPGISGIETSRRLKQRYGDRIEIIVQTVFEDPPTILEAIRAGISGYLLKGFGSEEVMTSLEEVCRGGSFLTGKVARRILVELSTGSCAPEYQLSERETEILNSLVAGLTYREIGQKLFLSPFTVNNHLRKVYEKMRVSSRHEASALWLKNQGTTACSD